MFSTQNIRLLHTTLPRLLRRRANPGVAHQLQALENEDALSEDPEGFGNAESDLINVHTTHRQHEAEMALQRERVRRLLVKQKYFNSVKLPNLLTYAEKEQMRLLHARDPEEWTAERLAEGFPATQAIVEKILKAKWRPCSTERIRKHDETVIKNWENLRENTLQLPPELREHLQKFAVRKKEDLQIPAEEWHTRSALPKPQRQEFLKLITSCSKYAGAAQSTNSNENAAQLKAGRVRADLSIATTAADKENETYLLDKVKDKRKMRLQELKQLKLPRAELANSWNDTAPTAASLEARAVAAFGNPDGTGVLPANKALYDYAKKFQSNEIIISVEDQKRYEMCGIKERVHIPRKLWRKGATYRVDDCYYDDDGELLYRVPGMTCK